MITFTPKAAHIAATVVVVLPLTILCALSAVGWYFVTEWAWDNGRWFVVIAMAVAACTWAMFVTILFAVWDARWTMYDKRFTKEKDE